jgi:protocatechuate 3,4-dioxygenase beta subunit
MKSNRRAFVNGLAVVGAGLLAPTGLAQSAEARDGRTPITRKELDGIVGSIFGSGLSCVETTQETEGPFYYESSLQRRSLVEGQLGVPLRLGITLAGLAVSNRCYPLAGAVVDVWHSSAAGLYSNVGRDIQPVDTTGKTFLRGHQITDDKGYVEFDTIVPGWEIVAAPAPLKVARRTVHIHVKVFHEREVLTTQLYLPDALIDQLYAEVEPYSSHRLLTAPGLDRAYERVRNAQDLLFNPAKVQPMNVERVNGVLVAKATIGAHSQGERGIRTLFR